MVKVLVALIVGGLGAGPACGARSGPEIGSQSHTGTSDAGPVADSGSPALSPDAEADAAPPPDSGLACDYADPSRHYVAKGDCATIDWGCKTGVPFQNVCGCGCILPDGGR
jgi:hypothetical protein